MSSITDSSINTGDALQPLRDAVATGRNEAILAAIPEPPQFLATVFALPTDDRDRLLVAVLQAVPTEEDRWEIIEAAAMDSIARPERGAFSAVAPYVSADLLDDARKLLPMFPDRSMTETIGTLLSLPRHL